MTSLEPRRTRRRLTRLAAVAIALLCLIATGLTGAQAAPESAAPESAAPAGATPVAVGPATVTGQVSADFGGGRIPPPPSKNQDYGIQFDPITSDVSRAKVSFDLPLLIFHSYLTVCFVTPTFQSPCPGHDVSTYPKLKFDYTWDIAFADNWVATRSGGKLQYGVFPAVHVSTLAFGAIPVSATVHITQTVHHGLVDPMKLLLPIDIAPVPVGKSIPGFGPAPRFRQGVTFFSFLGVIDGTVNITLSDVTVDRVPVDVGPDCQTGTPAHLHLIAPAGYYPQNVPPSELKGKPGEFQPLGGGGPGGYLQGTADIPAFSGCHNGADDLDPLLTAMISGPGNPLNAYSPHGLQSWCLEPTAHCSRHAAAVQRTQLALSPAAVRAALQTPAGRADLIESGSYSAPRATP